MGYSKICVLRHGEAMYSQTVVAIGHENDLTPNGVATVQRNTKEIALELTGFDRTHFFSSPIARTVQTTKMAVESISPESPISIRRCLTEQFNYSWDLMTALVNGGEYEIEKGEIILIDANLTNPSGKRVEEYGTKDIARIDPRVWEQSPMLARRALSIESNDQVVSRIHRFLNAVSRNVMDRQGVVIVTHDALIRPIVETAGVKSVTPGERVILSAENGQLWLERIAGETIPRKLLTI